jgi:hypothetical protein
MLTDINNNIDGYMRSLTGEGVYEKKLGGNVLSAGIRYSQSFVDNTYKNGYEYHTDMLQSTTFFYGEWKGKVQKLDYTLGAGVTRSCFRQEGSKDYDTWTFNPRIAMFYRLSGASSLRLTAGVNNWPPQLYTLSAVDQQVDSLQFVRGNPNLKPNLQYRTDLSWEWRKGIFYANMQGKYEYHPSGIMSEKFLENDKVFETWNNQKNWHGMSAILNLRVVPLKDILTVTVKGGVNRYISHGNSFRHVYTNPFCDAVLSGMYGNFNASLLWHTPVNRLYGENLNGGDNYHVLSLGYRYREMNFGLGAYSPFANDYRIDTENRSSVASYKRSYYSNQMSGLVYFQFAYNFSFGRKYHSGEKRLYNSNEGETSIMSTGK